MIIKFVKPICQKILEVQVSATFKKSMTILIKALTMVMYFYDNVQIIISITDNGTPVLTTIVADDFDN